MRMLAVALLSLLLAACSSIGDKRNPNEGRYSIKQDHGPRQTVNLDHVEDAVPRVEAKSRGGNKPSYRVLGKTYRVMDSAQGYKERGTASWYGNKFHGHKTSNGEVYDMYAMSAAHKSLPLPTYLRVTNLDNGRQVIVRVNDRGPFHGNRLIDLSYAAAYKLDMLRKGTARVELEAIDPRSWQRSTNVLAAAKAPPAPAVKPNPVVAVQPAAPSPAVNPAGATTAGVGGRFLQIGAFSTRQAAEQVRQNAQSVLDELSVRVTPVEVAGRTLYRVQAGPLLGSSAVQPLVDLLERAGYAGVRLVELP
ncbi:septal ring lytic transglycosylase RlpA family protein [Marinobacterium arenosum]|uniref:septal ring lytic transglycosylase RlpA family protein n=1 Tax=Marinobacterium arenosum TaxID=2862496 RepID=UPI001C94C56D|nr:septal ring lytic transglycosylase RlpA family protein [Marinobacterium arenosum]MBY4676210.1 septal ring lytic transglycosylase RlpA family protein [Marinobacterium arenosum]